MIDFVYLGLTLLTGVCILLVLAWLSISLEEIGLAAKKKKIMNVTLAGVLVWLFVTALLAQIGFLSVWDSKPPRIPFIPLSAFIVLIILNRTNLLKKLIDVTPRHWPVAMQSFRIFVELSFWGLFVAGGAPALVTFEGRNFDVVVGITALFMAWGICKIKFSAKFVILWNLLGLLVLSNTVFTLLTDMPGPIRRDWPGEPFTAFANWPFIWIPALLAPLAVGLHIVSIRQNLSLLMAPSRE